jgi:hypothetical protein
VLVVEGRDDYLFFQALLSHLGQATEFEIWEFQGIGKWPPYPAALRVTPGFDQVTSLGIVRDADQDAAATFQSICDALKRANLPVPPQIGVSAPGPPRVAAFVLPDCGSQGMLETLCIRSVAADPAIPCITRFFTCVSRRGLPMPASMDKARVRAFLASRQTPDLLLGHAAHAGHWPWDHPAFEPIKQFLLALL